MQKMERKAFEAALEQKVTWIERVLRAHLPQNPLFQETIYKAMEYSLMGGGKRLRPLIIYESSQLFGGAEDKMTECFMTAMEMIHTYSLVHDDLPAMDNDEYRRGRKTTHIVFGEDMGILTGDALLNYAYELIADALCDGGDAAAGCRAFRILSRKAGISGMVGGQVVDVERTGKPLDDEVLQFIYRLKTGALIEASFMVGAALSGACAQEIAVMEQIGTCVGMAFQIQDDILDVTGTTEELGKPAHSDERNEKITYVALHGMEKARRAVEEYSQKALELFGQLDRDNPFLYTLVEVLIQRKR